MATAKLRARRLLHSHSRPSFFETLESRTLLSSTPPFPDAPTSLTTASIADTGVTLAWTDNSADFSKFEVEQQGPVGNYVLVNAPTAASQTITGLTAGTLYHFRVRAQNAFGDSDYASLDVTTLPATPTGLSATATSPNDVELAWTPTAGAAASL